MALYAFDSGLAAQYGVSEAIFVHRLYFWVQENQKTAVTCGMGGTGRTTACPP